MVAEAGACDIDTNSFYFWIELASEDAEFQAGSLSLVKRRPLGAIDSGGLFRA